MKSIQNPEQVQRRCTVVTTTVGLALFSLTLAAPPLAHAASTTASDDVYELSPFEVQTSENDIGYYAENTLAGSRLNTNIGDLAASITVVTKQQLEDTGAIDINDVFLYESNTEGANTYTPYTLNRGAIRDSVGGYSNDQGELTDRQTANRVRGLGSVDTAQNNHPTISRVAFDTYNSNRVEINRGPNSMLFGTGSPAGIVNQSSSEAILGQQSTSISARIGSYGAWRASAGINIPIGDRLAFYGAMLYDERGYAREPSYDVYKRQYAAVTYAPFEKTRITGSFENYDNNNSRPNFAAPLDRVTPWLEAGRPGWNPATQMITIMDTGQVLGPYLTSTLDPRWTGPNTTVFPVGDAALFNTESARYVPGITFAGRYNQMVDQGEIVGFTNSSTTQVGNSAIAGRPTDSALTPEQWVIRATRMTISNGFATPAPPASTGATHWGNWYRPSLQDTSIYDFTKYNTQGGNYGAQEMKTWNLEVQQQILPDLNFSMGWLRQEMDEHAHYGLGQANNAVEVNIDTNTHNLDGTPNPYFGSPFVYDHQADTFVRPETSDSRRAMLAYSLDFTDNDGWTSWLGSHRFLALGSTHKRAIENLRYRRTFTGGNPLFVTAASSDPNWTGTWASGNMDRWYYMGQNPNGIIERGSQTNKEFGWGDPDGHAPMTYYDWNRGNAALAALPAGATAEQRMTALRTGYGVAETPYQPVLFYAGNNQGLTTRQIDSSSAAWQGNLWDGRIIPTLGWRKDKLMIRQYSSALSTADERQQNGFGILGPHTRLGAPYRIAGTTSTRGVVVRPFRGWGEGGASNGFADFIRGLSFHYNESDNFNAPDSVRQDFFGNRIPKPQGQGEDWGFGGSMFENKLNFKVNFYKATNQYATSAAANTVLGRTVRIDDGIFNWARQVVRVRHGGNPTLVDWDNNDVNPLTPQMITEISNLWGLPYDGESRWPNYENGSIVGTESNLSEGMEVQLIYNPVRNWNMKLTVGKQDASYSDAIGELQRWIAVRKPQWEALSAPDLTTVYTKSNGNLLYLGGSAWTDSYGFTGDANSNATGPTGSMRGTYNSIVVPDFFQLTSLQDTSTPNLRKWSASFITNYAFQEGLLKNFAFGGSARWMDKAVAGYYADLDPAKFTMPTATRINIVFPDLDRPIYTPAETHVDVWASYTTRVLDDRARMKVQLNVRDALEGSYLQAVLFNPDGSPAQYRIRDGREWFLTTTFDF